MRGYIVKLVRDRIGDRVGPARGFPYEPVTSREQHVKMLRAKLLEEATEYLLDPSLAELADVQQVVNDLAFIDVGLTPGAVRDAAAAKAVERGGFQRGVVMVATDEGYEGEPRPEWGEAVCGGATGFGAPGCTCGEHPPRGLASPHCPMHGGDRG